METKRYWGRATEFIEDYINRNPEASLSQIAKAANNHRLHVSHELVAEVRKKRAEKEMFNPPRVVEPKPVIPSKSGVTVRVVQLKQDPLRPLAVEVRPILSKPEPKPESTPMPAQVTTPSKTESEAPKEPTRNRRTYGVLRKITIVAPLNNEPEGNVAVVFECGHARTMLKSAVREMALCSICQKKEREEAMLLKPLKEMVRKFGTDRVLEVLSSLERQAPTEEESEE